MVLVERSSSGLSIRASTPFKNLKERLAWQSLASCLVMSVQTVLGAIAPDQLGITLPHEHICIDASLLRCPDSSGEDRGNAPFDWCNLHWIQQHPFGHRSNLELYKEMDTIKEELCSFRKAGGGTLVENSSIGLQRNVKVLRQLSLDSGVNIVCGTGFYVDSSHSKETRNMSEEQLAEVMRRELLEGVDGTGICCGIIGEIGCSWPITESEIRVLRAAATVQASLRCPLIVHPGRHHDSPFQIVRLLQESGADLHKTVMSHIDRTLFEKNQLLEFAKLGCYLEYDLFGLEVLDYELNLNVDMPCDSERIRRIQMLLEEGLVDQLLMSHDIFSCHRLSRFGGHGYSHILQNIVPKMKRRGVPQAAIERMLIHNPRTWLATCR
uniref:phosphotriesterase-related protein isoform X1 n=2 Tax=Myxine glutinosa TaxID=7769 RepID=UPI00358F46E9